MRNGGRGAQFIKRPISFLLVTSDWNFISLVTKIIYRINKKIKKSSIPKGTKDSWYHPILLTHCWINLYLYAGIDLDTSALYRARPGCFMIQPSWLKVHLPQRHPYSFSPTGALFTGFLCVLFLSLPICNCM